MKAAIYARYSTDMQNPASIKDQIRTCQEHVTAADGTTVQVYTDAAISGSSIKTRPGLQALIADAGLGKFDTVVAEALDLAELNECRLGALLHAPAAAKS